MAKVCKKTLVKGGVRFEFANGKVETVMVKDFPEDIQAMLPVFGLNHKLGDAYSSNDGAGDAWNKFQAVRESMLAGEWNLGRVSDGGLLAEAIARIKGIPLEKVQESLGKADEETKATLRKNEKVAAMLKVIAGERAQKKLEASEDDGLDFEV